MLRLLNNKETEIPNSDEVKELVIEESRHWDDIFTVRYEPYLLSLPNFLNLRVLKLLRCNLLTSLPDFENLVHAEINECQKLKWLPCWKKVEFVDCSKNNLVELPCWPNVIEVRCEWSTITEMPYWPKIKKVTISNCKVQTFPCWQTLVEIFIKSCNLTHLPCWPNVEQVRLIEQYTDFYVPEWPKLTEITLNKCWELSSIPNFESVKRVWIKKCGFKELPCFPNMERLDCYTDIIKCPNWPKIKRIDASDWSIDAIPPWPATYIELDGFYKLAAIPAFPNVEYLNVRGCSKIQAMEHLPKLRELIWNGGASGFYPIISSNVDATCGCLQASYYDGEKYVFSCNQRCKWDLVRHNVILAQLFEEWPLPYAARINSFMQKAPNYR